MNLKKPVLLHKICAHLIKGPSRHDLDVTLHFSAKKAYSLFFYIVVLLIVAVGISIVIFMLSIIARQ